MMIEFPLKALRKQIRSQAGHMEILYNPSALPEISDLQFNASAYLHAQAIEAQGGRGSAWFVESTAGAAVLKQYRRGGMMAIVSQNKYVYLGNTSVRSFAEFEILQQLQALRLPVPQALAAFCLRKNGLYQAALLTVRIPLTHSLVVAVQNGNAPWQKIGSTLASFHQVGAHHSDLNAQNILLNTKQEVFIIDWDKARMEHSAGAWCEQVLQRLQRSLFKECDTDLFPVIQHGMSLCREAYFEAMQ